MTVKLFQRLFKEIALHVFALTMKALQNVFELSNEADT